MTARGASCSTSPEPQWSGVWVDRLTGRQTSLVVAGLALHAHNAYNDQTKRRRHARPASTRPASAARCSGTCSHHGADGRVRWDTPEEVDAAQRAQEGRRRGTLALAEVRASGWGSEGSCWATSWTTARSSRMRSWPSPWRSTQQDATPGHRRRGSVRLLGPTDRGCTIRPRTDRTHQGGTGGEQPRLRGSPWP